MSPITFRFAALSPWMYRWVIESEECPAISWTSRSDPPASVIFFAIAVMNVLLPECDDAPVKPDFPISGVKPYRYSIRAIAWCSLAIDYGAIWPDPLASDCLQRQQRIRELTMKWDRPSASPAL